MLWARTIKKRKQKEGTLTTKDILKLFAANNTLYEVQWRPNCQYLDHASHG